MLTLLVVLAVALLLFVAAVVATQEGAVLADAEPDRADVGLPLHAVRAQDLDAVRFGMVLRGYRMSEVDAVLDRLGQELQARDARIAELEGALADIVAPVLGEAEAHQAATAVPAPTPIEPVASTPPAPEQTPAPSLPVPPFTTTLPSFPELPAWEPAVPVTEEPTFEPAAPAPVAEEPSPEPLAPVAEEPSPELVAPVAEEPEPAPEPTTPPATAWQPPPAVPGPTSLWPVESAFPEVPEPEAPSEDLPEATEDDAPPRP